MDQFSQVGEIRHEPRDLSDYGLSGLAFLSVYLQFLHRSGASAVQIVFAAGRSYTG
jgi:hypothetical protein